MPDKIKETKPSWQKLVTVEEAEAKAQDLIKKVLDEAKPIDVAGK